MTIPAGDAGDRQPGVGEPRRRALRRPRTLDVARAERPPPRLRSRHPLLPRRPARPDGRPARVRRAARPVPRTSVSQSHRTSCAGVTATGSSCAASRPFPSSRAEPLTPERSADRSSGLLPEPDHVAGGVAEGRDGQVPLGEGATTISPPLASMRSTTARTSVDVDVRQQPGRRRDLLVGHPRAGDMARPVAEAGAARFLAVHAPAEDRLVELGRSADSTAGMCRYEIPPSRASSASTRSSSSAMPSSLRAGGVSAGGG